jgi:hypothetical protein
MSLKTKCIKFNKTSIFFAQLASGVWVVPARLLGKALGYSKDGGKFVEAIAGWNFTPNDDFLDFDGEALARLKQDAPELGASMFSNSATFLTMRGVTRALLRSRSATAQDFRTFLVKNADEILSDDSRAKLPVKAKRVKKEVGPVETVLPADLQKPLTVLREMVDTGFFPKDDLMTLYRRVFESTLPEPKALPVVVSKDATQLVPVSNIQASSLTPNFTSIKGFFLTGHQKHPDFTDWLSSEEIGKTCGKTADQMKTFTTAYARNNGRELANNQARAAIIQAGGYFEGVSSLVDKNRLPTLVDTVIGCMTTWYLTEDGMLLWRNYWSPAAVEAVMKLIEVTPTKRAAPVAAPTLPLPAGRMFQEKGAIRAPAPTNGELSTGAALEPRVLPQVSEEH